MESRRPYPLDERGLPVSPEGIGECYELCLRGIRETNRHHLAWPRSEYKAKPARQYRSAIGMIVDACVCKHADLHSTYLPPKQPDIHAMYDVVQGDLTPSVAEVYIRPRNQANIEAV